MKVSLKFREEKKPLIKAKVPIAILGLPFFSSVTAGEPNDLRLDLVTAFASGPSLRASYRPNDPFSPFAVCLRTGAGCLGSPLGAPISMAAEFTLGSSPSFSVLFKQRVGDFSLKKVTSSNPKMMSPEMEDAAAVWVEKVNGGKVNGVGDLVTGVEVAARSALPIRSNAEVRFKWGVRIPEEVRTAYRSGGGVSFASLPLLAMSKISIVHVAKTDDDVSKAKKDDDVTEGWADVAKQLEEVRAENRRLVNAVEEISAWGRASARAVVSRESADISRGGGGGGARKVPEAKRIVQEGSGRAAVKEEAGEELKKALMEAARGGPVK